MQLKLYEPMTWYCDNCDDCLSYQDGFEELPQIWSCNKCGFPNVIDPVVIDTIGEEDIDYEDF